ncbi:phage baseplate protein [Veillonella ratti]|uniref:phage baseplate protein n=1 Tax=Veillonella ratti TaxID=103892 RepID=UPI000F8E3E53|nr:hypothetical protein [Veillonella ratti]
MAYQERYPLNDSPSGDTKRDAILKNRQEMLNIADEIDKKSNGNGGGGGLRNRVLTGNSTGGQYNYLSGDNLSVTIDGTVTPIVVTFADGFDKNGTVDYIKSITTRATPWVLPANTTSYLYVDYNASTGAINYDSTTIEPIISNTTPDTASNGSHYYNEMLGRTYAYNGQQWTPKIRVFLAAVDTTSTSITTIKYINRSDKTITNKMLQDNVITTDKVKDKSITADKLGDDVTKVINNVLDKVYPVGSIYCSTVSTNPKTLFGFGTWDYIEQGRVLLSQGSNYKAGSIGGEATHKLTNSEMPVHNHSGSVAASGNHNHGARADIQGSHNHGAWVGRNYSATGNYEGFDNGRFPLQTKAGDVGSAFLITELGGPHTHNITIDINGYHNHSIPSDGSNVAHNNMQPYLAVYMWKRVS